MRNLIPMVALSWFTGCAKEAPALVAAPAPSAALAPSTAPAQQVKPVGRVRAGREPIEPAPGLGADAEALVRVVDLLVEGGGDGTDVFTERGRPSSDLADVAKPRPWVDGERTGADVAATADLVTEIRRVDPLAGHGELSHDEAHAIAYGISVEHRARLLRCVEADTERTYAMILTFDTAGTVTEAESSGEIGQCMADVVVGLSLLPPRDRELRVNAPIHVGKRDPMQIQLSPD